MVADRQTPGDDLLLETLRPLILAGAEDVALEDYRAAVEALFAALKFRGWEFRCVVSEFHAPEKTATVQHKNNILPAC
jgi:hypothetical protein